jgi:tRNA(Ile)-lysidine synthase
VAPARGLSAPVTAPSRRLGGPGYSVVAKALEAIDHHSMLGEGDRVLVAVSGGPDSTCLLDVLLRIATKLRVSLEVAHVDHGLSDDSGRIAARVAAWAAGQGLEVHLGRAPDLAGPNLQARAREFRYRFLESVAARVHAARIATGHTLDDRVETTLARLVHGADTGGLAGLAPVEGPRVRPLIEVRRSQTRAYCEEVGLDFDDDPANVDVRFERAAVRSVLVPAIEDRFGEGAVRAIARAAEHLRQDAAALDDLASRLYTELARATDRGISFDRSAFMLMSRALRRRLLQRAVGRVRDRAAGIEAALDGLDRDPAPGAEFAVVQGVTIVIDADAVAVLRPGTPAP